jgi:hypothetical protein
VKVPWAEDRSRFTLLFEALAIRVLRETTLSGVAELMLVSWDEAEGIFQRAVARGLARRTQDPVRVVGVDETSFQKHPEYVPQSQQLSLRNPVALRRPRHGPMLIPEERKK